jgi:hypothetical protein
MDSLFVNFRNLGVLSVMVAAMALAYFSGGYAELHPVIFPAGLCVAIIISSYSALTMETPSLVVFLIISTLVAAIDEYAHTSAGTLTYFDHDVPSLLTVFGWGIFMLVMLSVARLIMKVPAFASNKNNRGEQWILRILPVIIPCLLIVLTVPILRYLPVFSPLLVLVYLLQAAFSLYFAGLLPMSRNLAVLIAGLLTGCLMEYLGALEGIWTFHYGEPVSLFILFSWPLRLWTVLCLCHLAGYDICGRPAGFAG